MPENLGNIVMILALLDSLSEDRAPIVPTIDFPSINLSWHFLKIATYLTQACAPLFGQVHGRRNLLIRDLFGRKCEGLIRGSLLDDDGLPE